MDLFFDILDSHRQEILPLLKNIDYGFYLAGGTGIALQLGHRDSIDFDFFRQESFSTTEMIERLRALFENYSLTIIQEEKDTLSVLINNEVKLSFFSYPYPQVRPLQNSEFFQLASLEDIGCMKLSAITSRSMLKDYVDLYYILKKISLTELLSFVKIKFPILDSNIILKSLVYFDDVTEEPIIFKHNSAVSFTEIKKALVEETARVLNNAIE